jgi:hypothetical protein
MRNTKSTPVLIILIISLLMVGFLTWSRFVEPTSAQTQENRKTQTWEYCYMSAPYTMPEGWKVTVSRGGKEEIRDSDTTGTAALNKLGSEGWELVGTSTNVTNQGNQTFTSFYLKRAR